jgi:Neutral/alkaline non-lysosomal ceramidase, N-terminal
LQRVALVLAFGCMIFAAHAAESAGVYWAGAARVDITPDYPVRLSGYAARKGEPDGVAQHLFARALAVGSRENPAVLITVDNCGVPLNVRTALLERLKSTIQLPAERLTICSTHTHSAPWLNGYVDNLFGAPLPADQQWRRDCYTRELIEKLEQVVALAIQNCEPCELAWEKTSAGFAANRRTPGGPVDHDLPALFVRTPQGRLRAIFASYACHCTTLTGEFNKVCGDWAGYAAEDLERDNPDAVALIALGCAGDANPHPRPGFDLARQHGAEIALKVNQARADLLVPVRGKLVCRLKRIELPLAPLPPRRYWETHAKDTNALGGLARLNLARLNCGEPLQSTIPYLVQTWCFGDRLCLVFLSGEVVVDYSLRLKRELDSSRLLVQAYANDVPCYIPSERVLREGGYEGEASMVYYARPAKFAPGLENRIVSTVHELAGARFQAPTPGNSGSSLPAVSSENAKPINN